MGDAFAQPALTAALLELIQALAHLGVTEKLGELLVDGINRLRMGGGHAVMARAV